MLENDIRALQTCQVKDGNLILRGITDKESIIRIGDELRLAIQEGFIPHIKVISSMIHSGSGQVVADYITKGRGVSKSYVELSSIFNRLIFADLGGTKDNVSLDRSSPNDCSKYGFVMTTCKDVTSDNNSLAYCGEVNKELKSLIKGVEIVQFYNETGVLYMMITEGTGVYDFTKTGNCVNGEYFIPNRQYFNLSPYLVVRRYLEGDECVKFMYKEDINEDVLQTIIRRYGESLEGGLY